MSKKNTGFLPIKTNWFDRLFIGVISFVAIQLLWMRFIEAFLSINFSITLGIFLLIFIIWKG
jgi:predicted small integral membrane protein